MYPCLQFFTEMAKDFGSLIGSCIGVLGGYYFATRKDRIQKNEKIERARRALEELYRAIEDRIDLLRKTKDKFEFRELLTMVKTNCEFSEKAADLIFNYLDETDFKRFGHAQKILYHLRDELIESIDKYRDQTASDPRNAEEKMKRRIDTLADDLRVRFLAFHKMADLKPLNPVLGGET